METVAAPLRLVKHRGDAAEALSTINIFHHPCLPLLPFLHLPEERVRRKGRGQPKAGKKWQGKVRAACKSWGLSKKDVDALKLRLREGNESFASMTERVQLNLATSYLRVSENYKWDYACDALIFQVVGGCTIGL